MWQFYWECLKMTGKSFKPSSIVMTRIFFVMSILGLISWVITNRLSLPDVSQTVSFWVFIAALVITIAISPYMVWKRDTQLLKPFNELNETQKKNPSAFVFPYIRSLSASPIVDGNERYLSLSLFFPTSLINEFEITPTIQLTLNGSTSEKLALSKTNISWRYVKRLTDVHIPLTEQMLNVVRQSVKEDKPVHVALKINTDSGLYYWETEELTTLLLTRVN